MGADARRAVLRGVNAIYYPVRSTLGPQGRMALLYRTYGRGPRMTDDGVTVAEVQEPKDPFIKIVSEAFKEMCKRTVEKVGDGTTTTAVIGGKLMNDIYNLTEENATTYTAKQSGSVAPMTMRRNILASAGRVKDEIKNRAKKIESLEDLEKIGIISVKDEKLGRVVAQMAYEVGVDGFIDVVEGYKGTIETEVIKGMRFAAKPGAKAFVNNPARFEMAAADCQVLVTNYAFDNGSECGPLLGKLNAATSKIIVIAPSFSENVLVGMINAVKQGYFIFPVAAPSLRTEQFQDVAIYCGAEFVDKNKGRKLAAVTERDLGFLEKLVVKDTSDREDAIALGGAGSKDTQYVTKAPTKTDAAEYETSSPVLKRIEELKGQLEETKIESHKLLMQRRIASLASAAGVIRVGATTNADILYTKLKVEDGVYACKSALRGGYMRGGGLELKEIAVDVLQEDDILMAALCEPYRLIQASVEGGLEIGPDIIDPADALYYAVEHASSVIANLATVDVITPEVEEIGPGDGYMAIARMIGEFVIAQKRQMGQITANEEEAERDRMGGLSAQEKITLDNG